MTIEEIKSILRDVGLRVTSNRVEVLMIISNHTKAIAYADLQKQLLSIDRVTLYRTIQSLMECKIIHIAMVDDDEKYYAMKNFQISAKEHDHLHFKCTVCNEVSCVHPKTPIHTSIPGYTINSIAVKITGVCSRCN
jgi:Fur family transcriptional regulator, ferric uptake regulator